MGSLRDLGAESFGPLLIDDDLDPESLEASFLTSFGLSKGFFVVYSQFQEQDSASKPINSSPYRPLAVFLKMLQRGDIALLPSFQSSDDDLEDIAPSVGKVRLSQTYT